MEEAAQDERDDDDVVELNVSVPTIAFACEGGLGAEETRGPIDSHLTCW